MTNSVSDFKKLAIVFALLSYSGYVTKVADNMLTKSGFSLLIICIENVSNIANWELHIVCFFFSAVFAALAFLFGALALTKGGIGVIVFSILGIASMLFFAGTIGFRHVGIGAYAYIVSLFLAFIFSLAGSIKQAE